MLSQYADRLKKMTTPDKEIIDEITLININRAFYLSVLSIIMRIFAIVSFLSNSPGDGIVNIWRTGIIVSHGVLLVLLLIFGGLSYNCAIWFSPRDTVLKCSNCLNRSIGNT